MDEQPAHLAPKDTQSTFIITSQQFFLLASVLLMAIGLYTPELLAEFARTGNPDLLPHQFLLPQDEPFLNSLQGAMNDANN